MSLTGSTPSPDRAAIATPWRFLPLLYFMQAIPVSIVQDLMAIVYKDLGVSNEAILKWTGVISLPWSLQMLLGPLVDLTGTKRAWVVRTQFFLAVALALVPFLLGLPYAFELSLITLAGVAVVSALCNTATDGFYLLAVPNRDVQATFAGVQSTAYRFGSLFVSALVVFLAGRLSEFRPETIDVRGGAVVVKSGKGEDRVATAELAVRDSLLTTSDGRSFVPSIEVPASVTSIAVETDGRVLASDGGTVRDLGRLTLVGAGPNGPSRTDGVALAERRSLARRMPVRTAWTIAGLFSAGVFALGLLFNRSRIPVPEADRPAETDGPEIRRNVLRTLAVVGLYGTTYFALSAVWKLVAHALSGLRPDLSGWRLPDSARFLGYDVGLGGPTAELVQAAVAIPASIGLFLLARRTIRGTAMGEAFASFFRQPGILAILGFLLFYRFGEAMVKGTAPLFLKELPSKGGLGIGNEQLAAINGLAGIGGIIVGGIVGGWFVGRLGLRRSLWPLAVVMHLPNLFYLWAAATRPATEVMYVVNFVDQFGYGFGYAGYTVILQRIAQRANFTTTHYAIGVGLGATFIALAKIVSGQIVAQYSFVGFFVAACLFTIPGMVSMLFVPLGEEKAAAA